LREASRSLNEEVDVSTQFIYFQRYSDSDPSKSSQSVATADMIDAVGRVAGVRSVHVKHPA